MRGLPGRFRGSIERIAPAVDTATRQILIIEFLFDKDLQEASQDVRDKISEIPVAIGAGEGGDFRALLARAVIGGVITSTLLTLLVIPTFYDILTGWRERVRRRLGQGTSATRQSAGVGAHAE